MNNLGSALAIDLGQSGSRIQLPSGERVDSRVFYEPKTNLVNAVEEIIKNIGNLKVETVCLSLTGLHGEVLLEKQLGEVCFQLTGSLKVAVCDDGLAWNLGALNGENGAIIAAGGGAVAVSRNDHKFAHVDGKGFELGDQGSAYWIGINSLRLAIKSKEGRAPETDLIKVAEDFFGSLLDLPKRKFTANQIHTLCIQFSEKVFELCERDEQATEILKSAAQELSLSAHAAASRVDLAGKDNVIIPVGGLFNNAWLKTQFKNFAISLDPTVKVGEPKGDALDGLMLLPRELDQVNNNLLKWWKK